MKIALISNTGIKNKPYIGPDGVEAGFSVVFSSQRQ